MAHELQDFEQFMHVQLEAAQAFINSDSAPISTIVDTSATYCPTKSFTTPRPPPAVSVARSSMIKVRSSESTLRWHAIGGSHFAIPVRSGESILKP